jgi:hypothetical protein
MACHTEIVPHGILPYSIPTMSETMFDSTINAVNWVDGNTKMRCVDAACTQMVSVRIDANESAYTIDSVNGGPNGTVVARVRNFGIHTTYMYHFRPQPYRYYFVVRPSGPSSQWILLEKLPGLKATPIDSGAFTGCFDHPRARSARADFKDCLPRGSVTAAPAILATAAPTTSELSHLFTEPRAWIGCAYGCCPM